MTAAKVLGLAALGVADRNSLAGVVRAHVAARDQGLKLLVGARLVPRGATSDDGVTPEDGRLPMEGPTVLCYPQDRAAYGRLCRLLTLGKRRAGKGECDFTFAELLEHSAGQQLIVLPETAPGAWAEAGPGMDLLRDALEALGAACPGRVSLAIGWRGDGQDQRRNEALAALAGRLALPLVAAGGVALHHPGRKALLDLVTCIRAHTTIDAAGFLLEANAERHLKDPAAVARRLADWPEALERSLEIAEACRFSLEELRYEYPEELVAEGETPQQSLERLTWAGARSRYGGTVPDRVKAALKHELALIGQLAYAPYFLTVEDIVRFARRNGILCQGRGSAANSAVCYCLGVTAVDPSRLDLLFERFVSAERDEPPDIDVDFEHERREEVIQYIYAKYGRDRAGLAATVICYRSRAAIRDAGKAMGLSADTIAALAGSIWGWSNDGIDEKVFRELGLDPGERRLAQTLELTRTLIGFPRHLSQHVGGFVMTRGLLSELVPIENAAMADRTVIEWDKDDLDALGMLKVDVLALGMLTCLRKGFDLLASHYGRSYTLASVPAEDEAVYDMLCRADSIGVFQVESRAQMTMLPRLKPRDFYDLVIEVAIVRPGPIQGDMVHPYLRRRNGEERVVFPSAELERVLGKTLGVPLFQEQAMQIAIVAAGFSPAEADQLRRAMATFKRGGQIEKFGEKLVGGMVARGYEEDFAARCFKQIEGFGTYGFPESHAASFALLVYVSAWMKCHYPAVFAAALLNSQPMGFYAPAQIVRDAREHGVELRPADLNHSHWNSTLEPGGPEGSFALRLGLRQIKSMREEDAAKLTAARGNGYPDILSLWRRAGVKRACLEALARADACRSLGLDRRQALWAIKGLPDDSPLPLFAAMEEEDRGPEPEVALPAMPLGAHVVEDYMSLRLSLKAHPLSFLRAGLAAQGVTPHAALFEMTDGRALTVAGLVLVRQRPGSAKGVIFCTLEDETGVANVVVWPDCFERYRATILKARLLMVEGKLQREGIVIHVVAARLTDMTHRLAELTEPRHPAPDPTLQPPLARADEVKRPTSDARQAIIRHPRNVNPLPPSRDFH